MGRSRSRKAIRRQRALRTRFRVQGEVGPRLWTNVGWGVSWGLAFAVAYSLLALLLYGLTGPGRFTRIGMTLTSTIGAYLLGGICGGALVGVLRPLTRRRLGATLVGVVACVPVSLGFGLAASGNPAHWREETIAATLLVPVLLGSILGYRFWEPPAEDRRAS